MNPEIHIGALFKIILKSISFPPTLFLNQAFFKLIFFYGSFHFISYNLVCMEQNKENNHVYLYTIKLK